MTLSIIFQSHADLMAHPCESQATLFELMDNAVFLPSTNGSAIDDSLGREVYVQSHVLNLRSNSHITIRLFTNTSLRPCSSDMQGGS